MLAQLLLKRQLIEDSQAFNPSQICFLASCPYEIVTPDEKRVYLCKRNNMDPHPLPNSDDDSSFDQENNQEHQEHLNCAVEIIISQRGGKQVVLD